MCNGLVARRHFPPDQSCPGTGAAQAVLKNQRAAVVFRYEWGIPTLPPTAFAIRELRTAAPAATAARPIWKTGKISGAERDNVMARVRGAGAFAASPLLPTLCVNPDGTVTAPAPDSRCRRRPLPPFAPFVVALPPCAPRPRAPAAPAPRLPRRGSGARARVKPPGGPRPGRRPGSRHRGPGGPPWPSPWPASWPAAHGPG